MEFDVLDLEQQDIRVVLRAQDVSQFEGNAPPEEDGRPMPDPLVTFVDAAAVGMLSRANVAPWRSGAQMLSREVDADDRCETCRIRIWNLDRGAFRVLANMLLARSPEHAEIVTESVPEGVRPSRLALDSLRYPAPAGPHPFAVDYLQPDRTARERYLQISFVHSPIPKELERIYAGLDLWARLPLMGGYPAKLVGSGTKHTAATIRAKREFKSGDSPWPLPYLNVDAFSGNRQRRASGQKFRSKRSKKRGQIYFHHSLASFTGRPGPRVSMRRPTIVSTCSANLEFSVSWPRFTASRINPHSPTGIPSFRNSRYLFRRLSSSSPSPEYSGSRSNHSAPSPPIRAA
jgi:hypothetical protein